ncbi:hypothetical protein A2962_03300 [Candidatus Woesebacteria bacterium RIFCSPLOWO2_01_FULL_39_61]|uniref:Polymerase/histidinol phosphatase N-terminal domain-containing protein n=1 Tax=Candidatus Woesebacteria bacterium RIFCSPHIGHO2_02_FULL_39_13 TaxID=1802505 RepID=A0A1F7Z330_9BACT|nr:MAG: hypothetical protein A2692_04385 [Candidatus Woesebacteria bacterium RIFCSPHIGHO2_01_FULL_39_95]OGM33850.1 MAG: hypothetical protein A3D01_02670 [Candidatus Woesebacteria bacterium RIFCSPHIGHO2_02_FULL_39_13]OGM39011.1 MAG: hypothetical protein A3E13_04940 [Candidatus Woesebacteria bacterium RIFCSPHIGHO2_12_FULL_40_20]OGM67516.1 MAG: hypothetical protein A2962_03300 [Candidatus Woesebacteria bacterium RIFCSPLOWO2_01_FULL_39_61]OGM72847.1 MAG: hypothetical protein A3H19_05805 [Candidatus
MKFKETTSKYQTLHSHTIVSDGLMSYKEVLEVCESNNIGVVAFTDHDSVPKESRVKELVDRKNNKTKWIIGIEISADKPDDFDKKFTPHIVGLFVNPYDANLLKHCKLAQEARKERMSRIVKNLNKIGFIVTEKDCLAASKGEAVGSPHIVQAIKSKKENIILIEKLRVQMKRDAKDNKILKEKYDKMIKRGVDQYPYVLFLSSDSYIQGIYVNYLYRIDLDTSVKLIRDAGGLAFFAHWFTEIEDCDAYLMEKLLKENRIDGAETIYGFYDNIKKDFIKQREILQSLIKKYNRLESGGVDAHNKNQIEDFAKDEWYAGLTIGMTERILSSGKVDKKWSSL